MSTRPVGPADSGAEQDPSATDLEATLSGVPADWKDVEPAIFGTLLERALDPVERHKLGAHYTPRAYVERLVVPTVVEPLREEWDAVRTAAITHARPCEEVYERVGEEVLYLWEMSAEIDE